MLCKCSSFPRYFFWISHFFLGCLNKRSQSTMKTKLGRLHFNSNNQDLFYIEHKPNGNLMTINHIYTYSIQQYSHRCKPLSCANQTVITWYSKRNYCGTNGSLLIFYFGFVHGCSSRTLKVTYNALHSMVKLSSGKLKYPNCCGVTCLPPILGQTIDSFLIFF